MHAGHPYPKVEVENAVSIADAEERLLLKEEHQKALQEEPPPSSQQQQHQQQPKQLPPMMPRQLGKAAAQHPSLPQRKQHEQAVSSGDSASSGSSNSATADAQAVVHPSDLLHDSHADKDAEQLAAVNVVVQQQQDTIVRQVWRGNGRPSCSSSYTSINACSTGKCPHMCRAHTCNAVLSPPFRSWPAATCASCPLHPLTLLLLLLLPPPPSAPL